MSRKVRRALERLSVTMDRNLPLVNRKLKKTVGSPQDAVAYSLAKYYIALNKLADK